MTIYSLKEEGEGHKNELKEYPPLLAKLLSFRDITTWEEAEKFLNPSYERDIYDPFLMTDMERGVERILEAIKNNEKICIFSDYDADGIPGGVLLKTLFEKIGYLNFFNYIPDRHFEGYGLSVIAIEKVVEMGAKVVISVDCGIVDFLPAEKCKKLGIDLIITDHHLPQTELPKAYAVINPKREGDKYPDKMLCGAGVAFKFATGIIQKGNFDIKDGWEKWLLDMAGLSTIADMVPLLNENRVLAHFGLKVLRKSRRPGLQQLLRKMKIDQRHLSEDDISFMIVPRINAASRMDEPMKAFNLLATNDEKEAETLAEFLNHINNERKGVVANMVKEINHKSDRFSDKNIIVIGNPDWRPGLLGLVANSVMEHFGKTTFVWGRDGLSGIKGSCRSNGSVNVVELMSTTAVFSEYGGHKFAGGFSVSEEKIHFLEKEIEEAYEKVRIKNFEEEVILADAKLTFSEINLDTYRMIEKMAPFGEGNPKPIFLLEGALITKMGQFGKDKNHFSITFSDGGKKSINAITFYSSSEDFKKMPEVGKNVDLAFHLEKSLFRGYPELRLRILEIF